MSEEAVKRYCQRNTLDFGKQIGFGIHGRVFTVIGREDSWITAAKVFDDESPFERELAVYRRLEELKVLRIGLFAVPVLVDFDTEERIIEMTLVDRPFCLDFASAYLDELPAYFPPFDQAWHEDKENQFGSEHWPEVLAAVRELESLGIYQTDVSPSNIALPKGQH